MDRIREIRPLDNPYAVYPKAQHVVQRLLGRTAAGPNGCVLWVGAADRDNYGDIKIAGKHLRAHRVLYQLLIAPLDGTLLVDHACHNSDEACQGGRGCLHRRCINPHHLDAVTNRENLLRSSRSIPSINSRKTQCSKGHPLDAGNVYVSATGRTCITCRRAYGRAYRQRIRAAKAPQ